MNDTVLYFLGTKTMKKRYGKAYHEWHNREAQDGS
jgi:hypothetical protein